jgi:TP901 family phage tail tape measure protein
MAWKDLLVRVGMDSRGFAKGASDIKRDTQGMKNNMAQLATEMRKQRDQLKQLGQSGKGASNEYRKLKTSIAENNGAFRAMQRELRAVEVAQGKVRTSTGGLLSSFKGVGGALTGGLIGGGVAGAAIMGIGALKAGLSDTLNVAVSFDDQMRKVAATSGATGRQFEMLKGAAIAMGSATRFTATQAGEALNFMALAGWNTEQAIAGLPGVLNLAAAAGTDLGLTSDILTDTMAAFGMQAKESTAAADVFAQVQSKSNTTVEQLGEAMKYAAPQAAAMGQSLESTATVLGLFANQGIKGTMAGTALNSMFKDLKAKADDGVLSFGKMNIELYDQQGRFRDLLDITNEMREGVKGLTQEQRNAITDGIFEERSIKGVNILLNSTDETIKTLAHSLQNATGRSKEMADMMEGGVGGSLRSMKSAWEGLQLTIMGEGGIAGAWYDFWKVKFAEWTVSVGGLKKLWRSFTGELEKPVKIERAINIGNVFDQQSKGSQQRPFGVFALPKELSEDGKNGGGGSSTKTASSEYRGLQKELQTTREYLKFVGAENEYIGEAMTMMGSAMESIFKMGGEEARKYAALVKGEMEALAAQTRGIVTPLAPLGPTAIKPPEQMGGEKGNLSEIINNLGLLNDKRREGIEIEGQFQNSMNQTMMMADMMGGAMGGLFERLASGYEGAGGALQGFAIEALNMAQTLISANLAVASSAIAKWAQAFGPAGPVIAAGAIAGVFGLVKGAIGKSKGVKLAKGGLAYGETMATVGDNPGARFDPEVVAPLSKLQGMLETRETVGGTFRIDGADLVLAYDNAKRKTKAFGR